MQNQHLTKFTAPFLLMLAASLLGGCASLAPLHKETKTSTANHSSASPIHIETRNGSVTLKSSDRDDVSVTAHIQAISEERLQETEIITEQLPSGVLSIQVKWPEGKARNREACSFEVLVPDAYGATIHTSNGRIVVSGIGGEAKLTSSNGKIEVYNHNGSVTAKTSNGAILVEGIEGDSTLRSSNGKITAKNTAGSVKANTSNGAIQIEMSSESSGPVNAQTSNGAITFLLSEAFSGELNLKTSNGGINTSNLPNARFISSSKNQIRLQCGDSNTLSEAITSNGPIRVTGPEQ